MAVENLMYPPVKGNPFDSTRVSLLEERIAFLESRIAYLEAQMRAREIPPVPPVTPYYPPMPTHPYPPFTISPNTSIPCRMNIQCQTLSGLPETPATTS